MIRDLANEGVVSVLPAGNEGPEPSSCDREETCHFNLLAVQPSPVGPDRPSPVAVGATPRLSRTALEGYSSRGDPEEHTFRGQAFRYEPTLVAPGTGVSAAERPGLAPFAHLPGSHLGGGPGADASGPAGPAVATWRCRGPASPPPTWPGPSP